MVILINSSFESLKCLTLSPKTNPKKKISFQFTFLRFYIELDHIESTSLINGSN